MKDRLEYLDSIKDSGLINEIYEYMLKHDPEFKQFCEEIGHELVTEIKKR